MRGIRKSLRRPLITLSGIAAVVIAGAAFAYLSAPGAGVGSGSVDAGTSNLVLTSSPLSFTALSQSQPITIYAHNLGTSAEQVGGVTAAVASADSGRCPAGSFTIDTPVLTAQEVQPGQTVPVATAHVTLNDLPVRQDGCIGGGTVTLAFSSSSSPPTT